MIQPEERTLTAWGRSSESRSAVYTLRNEKDAREALQGVIPDASALGIIARGYGRSYGDQCLNEGGRVIDTTGINAIRSFDASTGALDCEAGVSFAQLMNETLPKGWMPAVCPGTSFVSMGGAIANDVHGKNQHHFGTFSHHVHSFELLLPDGMVTRVSASLNDPLFRATAAGIGMTGVILSVRMQLRRVASNAFNLTETRIPNLQAFIEQLAEASRQHEYAVGWIDAFTGGPHMGRGVLETAHHSDSSIDLRRRRELNVPFDFPSWVLNRASVGAFNSLYYHRIPTRGRTRTVHAAQFLYALDALHNWNRLYGKRGVYQFQCALPFSSAQHGLTQILKESVASHSASFLAVLKCMGQRGPGMLSFTRPGFSLALDFPRRPDTFALVDRLHDIVIDHGGAVYLAKDSCLSARKFEAMYPEASEFRAVIDRIDPLHTMQSDMARRLGLR